MRAGYAAISPEAPHPPQRALTTGAGYLGCCCASPALQALGTFQARWMVVSGGGEAICQILCEEVQNVDVKSV